MTCIVAVRGETAVWMACDSQVSNNGAVMLHALPKIVKRDGFLFASDGHLWLGDACRYGSIPLWLEGTSLAEWCSTRFGPWLGALATDGNRWVDRNGGKEWNGQTLVARGKELVLVDSGGSVIVPVQGWWAIGSGGAEARGALYALLNGHWLAHQAATLAVEAACAMDDGCREPIICLSTEQED